MEPSDRLDAAKAMRRRILGDAYVEATTSSDPAMAELTDFVTETAWGVWTREGALSTRDRSLLVLAMTAALGRTDELRLHLAAAPNAGVTDDEVNELLYQLTPALTEARRWMRNSSMRPVAAVIASTSRLRSRVVSGPPRAHTPQAMAVR